LSTASFILFVLLEMFVALFKIGYKFDIPNQQGSIQISFSSLIKAFGN